LRGIGALSVAFFHFNVGGHFNNTFGDNAGILVDGFFVLSGFVIALNYIDRIKTTQDLIIFQRKRFLRLYPLHIIMLFAFVIVEVAKYFVEVKFGLIANNRAFTTNNINAFLANAMLIQNWVLPTLTYNGPSWSISAEFYTYAIFGILLVLTNRRRKLLVTSLIVSILGFGFLLSVNGMSSDNISGPLRCLYAFSIGALACCAYNFLRNTIVLKSSIPSVISLISSIVIVIFFGVKESNFVELIPLFFGMTILVLVLTKQDQKIHRALSNDWTVYLGTISYGIYMIHTLIWWILTQTLRLVLKVPTQVNPDGTVTILIDNVFFADLLSVIGVVIVIFLAHFSYKYVETRFDRIR
jgi:peptidoglycan/LPS O-acetylase OafA/YrhL